MWAILEEVRQGGLSEQVKKDTAWRMAFAVVPMQEKEKVMDEGNKVKEFSQTPLPHTPSINQIL